MAWQCRTARRTDCARLPVPVAASARLCATRPDLCTMAVATAFEGPRFEPGPGASHATSQPMRQSRAPSGLLYFFFFFGVE